MIDRAPLRDMDRGDSQLGGDRVLPGDMSGAGFPPVNSFESSDEEEDDMREEEGVSSEPEVRFYPTHRCLMTDLVNMQ